MGLARSTFYDRPPAAVPGKADLAGRIGAICDAFAGYGYRRVGAALRQEGLIVNHKKLRRVMREHVAAAAATAVRGDHRQPP
jgi:putative transposase